MFGAHEHSKSLDSPTVVCPGVHFSVSGSKCFDLSVSHRVGGLLEGERW